MSQVQFGMPVPQVFLDGRVDMELVCDVLRKGEALGYHSAWVQDQVAGDTPLLESVSLLCYAAAITERMRLGVSVIVFPIRNAVQLAKNFATLDLMSGGRAILGIGLGPIFAGDNYFQIFGTTAGEALRRFNEGLEIMRRLWTETEVNHAGEFYTLHKTGMEPKPLQKPHLPVWFGGQHPQALRRAARESNGYMGAGPTTTKDFAWQVQQLQQYLDEAGREPAECPISKRVYLAMDAADPARGKRRLDEFFAARYPWQIDKNSNFVADICYWGGPEQVADGLRNVVDAGAEMILVNPLWDFEEQLEILATDVLPLLH